MSVLSPYGLFELPFWGYAVVVFVTIQVMLSMVEKLNDVGKLPNPLGCATPPNVTLFVCSASVRALGSSWTG